MKTLLLVLATTIICYGQSDSTVKEDELYLYQKGDSLFMRMILVEKDWQEYLLDSMVIEFPKEKKKITGHASRIPYTDSIYLGSVKKIKHPKYIVLFYGGLFIVSKDEYKF